MKKIFKYALLYVLFLCTIIKVNAQCNTNPIYKDLIEWLQGSSHAIAVQVTVINPAAKDGSHYYTAWGKENFIFTGPIQKGGPKINRCRLINEHRAAFMFSDREKALLNNVFNPFSVSRPDKHNFSIDVSNNAIISESITWHFTITYNNVIRKGNIFYAFSGNSMIVLNVRFIDNTVL